MSFGQVLRSLRKEVNMTQKQLASVFKISESTIGMYERDAREPAFEMQEAIADYFNVDMDYLMGRSKIRREVTYTPVEPDPLDDTHKQLLKMFDSLDPASQQFVLAQLRGAVLAQQAKDNESEEN